MDSVVHAADHAPLIGLPLGSDEVRQFLEAHRFEHSKDGTVSFDFFDSYELGIGCVAEAGLLQSVFYTAGDEDFERYAGRLPERLVFGETEAAVLRRLGPAAMTSTPTAVHRWALNTVALALTFEAGALIQVALEAKELYLESESALKARTNAAPALGLRLFA